MGSKSYTMGKMRKIGILFPGQASQYVGMGKDFLERFPESSEILELGEKITGLPLIKLCLEGPIERLTETRVCQPAVFGVSLLCWKVLEENKLDFIPFRTAGHSLGEYTSLVASGVFSIEDGFSIVKKRAQAMDEVSKKIDGTMLAVLGKSLSEVKKILKDFKGIEISNINCHSQIVVGGKREHLETLYDYLRGNKIKAIFLKVSGAFHTSYMEKAVSVIESELEKVEIQDPLFPVYVNYSGERVEKKEYIKNSLLKQLVSSVKWINIIENMVRDGVEVFIEVGPGKILKGLVEKIVSSVPVFNVENTKSLKNTVDYLNN